MDKEGRHKMCQLPVAGAGSCASSSTSVQGGDKDQFREREGETEAVSH